MEMFSSLLEASGKPEPAQPEAGLPVLWGEVFVLADFGHSHVPCGWKARSAAGDTRIKVLLLSSFQMSLKNPVNRHSELLLHR